jgi:hypothetical protein
VEESDRERTDMVAYGPPYSDFASAPKLTGGIFNVMLSRHLRIYIARRLALGGLLSRIFAGVSATAR